MRANMIQTAAIMIIETPIKTSGAEPIAPELLERQAEQARICLTTVDYRAVRGTCIDERPRLILLGGETEARPSVPGGPDIFGLSIYELIGGLEKSDMSAAERLRYVKALINEGGIRSGGHTGCAANAGLVVWMRTIAENPDSVRAYAESQMGDRYRPELADQVAGNAVKFMDSGLYEAWTENLLADVYGEEAGDAIEKLEDVPHEGLTIVRNKIHGATVDQNELYLRSVVGKGSFVMDDAYADDIEHVLSSGPDAADNKLLAEHAREMILAAVAGAVPNEELYQINVT